jgi:hypothetical protein
MSNTLKISALVDKAGYVTPVRFHFPKAWSLEQREAFIRNKEQVEQVSVTIYSSDVSRFRLNLTEEEELRLCYEYYNQGWFEATDFHEARGDV